MAQGAADGIINLLHSLSEEDLARVRAELGVSTRAETRKLRAGEEFAVALFDAIAAQREKRTQVKSEPWDAFCKTKAHGRFLKAAALALESHEKWFPHQTKAERGSILALYAELLLDYLANARMAAHWSNIAWALRSLADVVDLAFPGYAASGLLGRVMEIRARGNA